MPADSQPERAAVPADGALLEERNRELAHALAEAQQECERLRRTGAEQRELLDALSDLCMVLDAEGTYVQLPATAPDLLYRPAQELVGRRMHDVLPREHADQFLAVIREALDTRSVVRLEYELPIDGRTTWFSGVVTPLAGDRVLWVSRDVTAQHAAEAALRASEERYRLLFESNPMPMWVYDRATLAFLAVNDAAQRQYGYSAEEFLTMTLADIRPAEDVTRLREAVARAPRKLHRHSGGWRHRRRDGSLIDVEITAYPFVFDGHDAELVLAHDITLRRTAELELSETTEILRAVVDGSPIAIIATDIDLVVTRWNPAAEKLLGWTSAEIVGRSFLTLIGENELATHVAAREAVIRGETVDTYETQRRRRDGTFVDVAVSPAALHDATGAVNGFVVLLTDITERRRLELRLLRSQKMEALGQLAGGVAHDFNNLLTAISSYSQFLLDDLPDTDPRHTDVLEIRRAAERAAALTRQLLSFSRQQVVTPRVVSINAIVLDVEKMLRRLVREDIDITLDLDPALGAVLADPGQIEQVLVNIVVNARDALPNGGSILISTANTELSGESARDGGEGAVPDARYVRLTVSDTGTGMSEDIQGRIFEPFFTTKEPGRGTGLGLATVYGIVRQADGQISVYSEPGHGSSFRIRLPRVDAPETQVAVPDHGPVFGGSETILLVEDDEAVRAVARRILARLGYTLIEAANGAEALAAAAERAADIDLVLTDMVMPGMSGPDLAAQLRATRPRLPIVFMSGYSRDAARQLGRFESGTGYVEKPFSPAQLANRVRELLDEQADPE